VCTECPGGMTDCFECDYRPSSSYYYPNYGSLQFTVGKDAAPVVVALGSVTILALLTALTVAVHRCRGTASRDQQCEHVGLANSSELASSESEDEMLGADGDGSSDEHERAKLTATV
jgi:hypothetical protein